MAEFNKERILYSSEAPLEIILSDDSDLEEIQVWVDPGSTKRCHDDENCNKVKKQKVDKLTSNTFVKLTRCPLVEKLVSQELAVGRVKYSNVLHQYLLADGFGVTPSTVETSGGNLIFTQAGEWHGWEMPNPRFLQTKKLLEDLIINTQCQRDSSYSDILEEYINLDRDNLLQMESYELKEQCSEEFHEGIIDIFYGFDHDPLIGPFRGCEKVNTKSRDCMNQIVKALQMDFTIQSKLSDCISSIEKLAEGLFYKNQMEQTECQMLQLYEMSNQSIQENLENIIDRHIETLNGFVTSTFLEPPFSFLVLVVIAIRSSSSTSLSMNDIIQYIRDHFPYYRLCSTSWTIAVQNTIKWHDEFIKVCKNCGTCTMSQEHGGCWSVDSVAAERILAHAVGVQYRKVKGELCFNKTVLANGIHHCKAETREQSRKPKSLLQTIEACNNIVKPKSEGPKSCTAKSDQEKKVGVQDTYDKIQLILKAAENLESNNGLETKLQYQNFKENNEIIKLNEVKVHQCLKIPAVKCFEVWTEQNKQDRVNKEAPIKLFQENELNRKIAGHLQILMDFVAGDPSAEPPFSYLVLAVMALKSSSKASIPLVDIFQFIRDRFPYYRSPNDSWTVAAQRTINWNSVFVKSCQGTCQGKKPNGHEGGCWSANTLKAEEILARAVEAHSEKEKEYKNENNFSSSRTTNKEANFMDVDKSCSPLEVSRNTSIMCEINKQKESNFTTALNEQANICDIQIKNTNFGAVETCQKSYCYNVKIQNDTINSKDFHKTTDIYGLKDEITIGAQHLNCAHNCRHTCNNMRATRRNSTNLSEDESVSTDSGTNFTEDKSDTILQDNKQGKTNENQRFHCQDCDKIFICLFYLKHHECSEAKTVSGYPCYLCHNICTNDDEFRLHLESVHRGVVNKHITSPSCWTVKHCTVIQKSVLHYPFMCSQCPAEFPNQGILDAHIKFVHS